MFLTGIGTSLPLHRYTQDACWAAIQASSVFPILSKRSQLLLRKVLQADNGIETRYFVLNPLNQAFNLTPEVMQRRFEDHAPSLAAEAGRRALHQANLHALDIDAVLVSTCTGYLCPGLTSYVAESLGLDQGVLALDLVGQGCGAALPNLRTAEALITAKRSRNVLSICVEICSAAFYLDDDPGVLISACLFGDGAGAAVLSDRANPSLPRMEWIDSASLLRPSERDLLRFSHEKGMLRNILTPQVPNLAAQSAHATFNLVGKKTGIAQTDIQSWIWHAGGRDVLSALQKEFGLPESAIRHSEEVLRTVGNISSPFVLHVLEKSLRENLPEGYCWMSSFGAGFSCHGALWKVQRN